MMDDKKKDKKEPVGDLSTPTILDPDFFKWMMRHFQGDEQVNEVSVHQVLGRTGRGEGECIRRRAVGHLKVEGSVNREELGVVCNELIEEMQDEANQMQQTRRFSVVAYNAKKGGAFARKYITRDPERVALRPVGDHDGDETDPLGGDLLRKRAEIVLQDGRFYAEHVTTSLGGIVQLLHEQLKGKDQQINELFRSNMEYARLLNEAENNKLDRDLIREEKMVMLTAKKKGIGLIAGLLPDFLKKVTDGAVQVPGGRTPESMAIEAVMDEKSGGLSADEKLKVFGHWTDTGERLTPGILSETQVRIIVGVLNEKAPPSELDRMIIDGSPEQLTEKQYMDIMAALGGDIDKLMPLVKILQTHKAAIDQKAQPTSHPASGR